MHYCLKQEDASHGFLLRIEEDKLMGRVWAGEQRLQVIDIIPGYRDAEKRQNIDGDLDTGS